MSESIPTQSVLEKIESLAAEVAHREGLCIYDIELTRSAGQRVLRIYIDRLVEAAESSAEAMGPISVEDCAKVSNGLSVLLDVEDPIPGDSYDLEVSSPGLERALKRFWHFERAVGKKVTLRTTVPPFEGLNRKVFTGELLGTSKVDQPMIQIRVDQQEYTIPFELIEKAQTIFEIVKGRKK